MELDRETGRTVSVTMVLASLATLSARSLPGMAEWPGIHWTKMEDDMEFNYMEYFLQQMKFNFKSIKLTVAKE